MKLEGSCHCAAVHFSVESYTPYPFNYCYCSVCRKTAGGGGFAINIMGEANQFEVKGMKHVAVYRAKFRSNKLGRSRLGSCRRHFCKHCASYLWISDPDWPEWIYPFASAIDTPLPKPPERYHLMLQSAAKWCGIPTGKREQHFSRYPKESIAQWHHRHNLYQQRD